jgi:hypothetical protein
MAKRKLLKYRQVRLLTPIGNIKDYGGWRVTKIPLEYKGYKFEAYFEKQDVFIEDAVLRKHNRYNKKGDLTSMVRTLQMKVDDDYWIGVSIDIRIPVKRIRIEMNYPTYEVNTEKLKQNIIKTVQKATGIVFEPKDIITCCYGQTYPVYDEYQEDEEKKHLYDLVQPMSGFSVKIPNQRTRKLFKFQVSEL